MRLVFGTGNIEFCRLIVYFCSSKLQSMSAIRETTLEIDLNALAHNYHYLRSRLTEKTKLMGVVKAYAYGSDSVEIARKLESLGAEFLAVAYESEGIFLRKNGIKLPILVFHSQETHFDEIIAYELTPSIYSRLTLTKFMEAAEKNNCEAYPVHLNLNTGLNRLGFDPGDLDFVITELSKTTAVKTQGIYSHLAASEDKNERDFTLKQYNLFKSESERLIKELDCKPLLHLCNTSGMLNYPEFHFDMVRCGIGLYGYGNTSAEDKNLQPVASLKTRISQIHHLQKGDSVSYNRKFIAPKAMKTATLPIGYADGLHRGYSNGKTSVLIHGQTAPIIGYICMDMIMVDVTSVDCKEGDEVLVFGKTQTASGLAATAGTISYEVITTISQRVKRVVIG